MGLLNASKLFIFTLQPLPLLPWTTGGFFLISQWCKLQPTPSPILYPIVARMIFLNKISNHKLLFYLKSSSGLWLSSKCRIDSSMPWEDLMSLLQGSLFCYSWSLHRDGIHHPGKSALVSRLCVTHTYSPPIAGEKSPSSYTQSVGNCLPCAPLCFTTQYYWLLIALSS